MGPVRRVWAYALLASGCGTSTEPLAIPSRDAGSALVVAVGGRDGPRALALDFPGSRQLELTVDADQPLTLYAGYFECSLAWLGVSAEGPHLSPTGSNLAWALADEVWTTEQGSDGAQAWRALPGADPRLQSLTLDQPRPDQRCEVLSSEALLLPGTDQNARVTFAIPLGAEQVLFGFDKFIPPVLLGPEGGQAMQALPAVPYLAGHRTFDGELFIATATGAVRRGGLESGFRSAGQLTRVPAGPPAYGGRFVSGERGGSLELYHFSITRAVERWDGPGWTVVAETPTASDDGMSNTLRFGAPRPHTKMPQREPVTMAVQRY